MILALSALVVAAVVALSLASWRRPPSGLVEGRLRPCPTTPNCASSVCEDGDHRVESLAFFGDPYGAFERLVGLVQGMPRTELLSLEDSYAHFEVVTRLLRFRGDLELHLDAEAGRIHLRSASRVGHGDFGANRKLIEQVRALFQGRER